MSGFKLRRLGVVMEPEPGNLQEIEGVHNRGDFDLKQHQEFSGKKLEYFDQPNNRRFVPYVVETSVGADRTALAASAASIAEPPVRSTSTPAEEASEWGEVTRPFGARVAGRPVSISVMRSYWIVWQGVDRGAGASYFLTIRLSIS